LAKYETDENNGKPSSLNPYGSTSLSSGFPFDIFNDSISTHHVCKGQNIEVRKETLTYTDGLFTVTESENKNGEDIFTTPDTSHVQDNVDGFTQTKTSPLSVMDMFDQLESVAYGDSLLDMEARENHAESEVDRMNTLKHTAGFTGNSYSSSNNISDTSLHKMLPYCVLVGAEELTLCNEVIGSLISSPENMVRGAMKESFYREWQQNAHRHQSSYQEGDKCTSAEQAVLSSYECGLQYIESGKFDEAVELFEGFLNKCDEGTLHFENTGIKNQVIGNTMHNIGTILMRAGNFNINDIWKETIGMKSNNAKIGLYQPIVANSLNEMGICLFACKNYRKALKVFTDTLRIRQKVHGVEHEWIAKSINNIGVTYFAMENPHAALEAFDEALEVCRPVLVYRSQAYVIDLINKRGTKNLTNNRNDALIRGGNNIDTRRILAAVSNTLYNIAHVNVYLNQIDNALVAIEEAVTVQKMIFGSKDQRTEHSSMCLSYLRSMQKSPLKGEKTPQTQEKISN